jgi:hypothetical protein
LFVQISNLTTDLADGMCIAHAMAAARPDLRMHALPDFAALSDAERAQYLFAHLPEVLSSGWRDSSSRRSIHHALAQSRLLFPF